MSTTPSTTEDSYTVVGTVANSGDPERGIGALVLSRAARQTRAEELAALESAGFSEVLVVLDSLPHYDVEQLAGRLRRTRFLLFGAPMNVGAHINTAMREAAASLVFVMTSDCDVPPLSDRIVQRIRELDAICVVPSLRNERGDPVPSLIAPARHGGRFVTLPMAPHSSVSVSLYPYSHIGVFHRERFLKSTGYDTSMRNPYWQSIDFGFRSYLWGESIPCLPSLRIRVARPIPPDDTTLDADYARFHLKNLSVRFSRDSARLSSGQLLRFVSRSGLGLVRGIREFNRIRSWVCANRYRFVQDARRVTELWEVDG